MTPMHIAHDPTSTATDAAVVRILERREVNNGDVASNPSVAPKWQM
jgi:hypothetical protein